MRVLTVLLALLVAQTAHAVAPTIGGSAVAGTGGASPAAMGAINFTADANSSYVVTLWADPVSSTDPDVYQNICSVNVTTDATGYASVDATRLHGNLPLATSGWWVYIEIAWTDGTNWYNVTTTDVWISVDSGQ